jgi:Apea-like HEPN
MLITTTVRTRLPVLRPADRWGTDDEAAEAVKRRLAILRLALLLGSEQVTGADVPDWVRTTITGFALLVPFAGIPGWTIATGSGDPAGRDLSPDEQTACVSTAAHLSTLNLDNIQLPIDRFLLAATERTTAPDALVDAVVVLEGLFGSAGEAVLRVSAAVAWLLEPDSADARTELFSEVGKIYRARSSVVHGNRSQRREGEGLVIDAVRLALHVLSKIFYSSQWLLDTSTSRDRGLALILGNQSLGRTPNEEQRSAGQTETS